MVTIRQIETPAEIADAQDIVREFTDWALTLTPDAVDAPAFAGLEAELATLPGKYGPPTGCFLLAYDGDRPVGCVCFFSHGEDVVELKRMYVRPDQRGRRVGQKLVDTLIDQARASGMHRIVLDSYHTMHSAHRVYRNTGFQDVPAPKGFPAQYKDRVVFMALDL